MYTEREMEILLKLAEKPLEEWACIYPIVNNIEADLINIQRKDGLVEVNGKHMRLTSLGRKFLMEFKKSQES